MSHVRPLCRSPRYHACLHSGRSRVQWIAALGTAWLLCVTSARAGNAPRLRFTTAQVDAGRAAYGHSCAVCHGIELEGGSGPALRGPPFQRMWMTGTRTLRDLYDANATRMPLNAPGSLPPSQGLEITAFILSRNGYPSGSEALTPSGMHQRLTAAAARPGTDGRAIQDGFGFRHGPGRARPRRNSGWKGAAGPLPAAPATVALATTPSPRQSEILHVAPANWLTYNRDYQGDRYSPLAEINVRNAGSLAVACAFQLGEVGAFENSPLVYDGRMFVTSNHKVFALDAATCALLWGFTYVPQGPESFPAGRGMALYEGKLFRGTSDGYLLALDAATGNLLWQVHVADSTLGYCISGAPVAFDGKVFVGECGGDSGIRGHVFAFDATTGALAWTFDTIPTGNEAGAQTWGGASEHGGGPSWSTMTIDPAHELLLVPVGNPGPDFNGRHRPGINLYTDSIVALQVATGRLAWYVQQVPHDTHDWDTAAAPAIFDRGGKRLMAVASKSGFLFVYDRTTRRLIARSPTTGAYFNASAPLSLSKPTTYCPGSHGQWNGPAYAPSTGMLFVGSEQRCDTVVLTHPRFVPGLPYYAGRILTDQRNIGIGWIHGYDATTGRTIWSYRSPTPISAALTATAGGLILTGDMAGNFLALDQRTGKVLYKFMTGGAVAGGVTSYAVAGRQYLAVASGNTSRDVTASTGAATIFVFTLCRSSPREPAP
jgi:PQQ-dependent dehydrogenase (methanol/ethanol family)